MKLDKRFTPSHSIQAIYPQQINFRQIEKERHLGKLCVPCPFRIQFLWFLYFNVGGGQKIQCYFCKEKLYDRASLTRHIENKHKDVKANTCPIKSCNKHKVKYYRKNYLQEHVNEKHKNAGLEITDDMFKS